MNEPFAYTEIQTQGRVVLQMKVEFIFNVSYRLLQWKGVGVGREKL